MFKLESYITPILLDYVSKYVKNIRQEDFQLSLWEGEVALHNLDLRLDVLQEELSLPVEFISGHIHDLSIRVPWTKITSEPIVITINTIEFVLKLKNPREDGAGSSANSSPQRTSEKKRKRKCPPKPEERASNPESSSSWLVSKIIHNISLQCHNIILKYVEEDIVVSMNIQLLSFGSATEKWESGMIDVHPIKVLMRKLVKISDLTICLDKRNSAGQIDVCQEPILYRSSFECRILLKYNANNPESNRITRIGIFTSLLDMNISSMQIPLCLRLIKLVLAFKDGKISKITTPDATEECVEEEESAPEDQSYLQWAWNKLPSISFAPGYEDEPTNELPCHTLDIGFYAEQLSFTLKGAEFVTDTHMTATKRIRYSPIVRLTIMGMYFELVSAEARNWLSVKAGVTSICVEPLGVYQLDGGKLIHSDENRNKRPFIDKSLFDEQCDLIADKGWGVTNYDEYTARITDDYLLYRSPVLAFDLIKYKQTPGTDSASSTSRSGGNSSHGDLENRVQYRFLTAGLTFRYSQTLEQVKHLISEFISSYDYPAYYTETLDGGGVCPSAVVHKLPPPLMEDYDSLMRHIPLCTYKFSIQRLTVEFHAKTEVEVATTKPPFRRLNSGGFRSGVLPPHFIINVASVEGSMSTPLQPDKLVHTTCQLPDKPQQLLDACYENYEMQIKDFSCYLRNAAEDRSTRILHIPSLSGKYGKLLQPQLWKDDTIEVQKLILFCESIKMDFTRRELSSSYYLMHCAWSYRAAMLRRLLRQEAPDLAIEDNTKLQNSFSKFRLQLQHTSKQKNWNLTLYGLETSVVYKQRFDVVKQMVFSTTATRSSLEVQRWLECSVLFANDDVGKQKKSKDAVGIWMAPFGFKIDANLIQFLRFEKFDEMDRETIIESIINSQILNIPNMPSSGSIQSQTGSILNASQPVPTPPAARRSSRSSLQIRKVSHPEETIHVSSERDEKLDKETTTSTSPKSSPEPGNKPTWLSIIKSYEFYIEVESGTIHIAEDLETDAVLTKIILPRVLLKPSNIEVVKSATFRQLFSPMMASKDKSNISWTLILNDFAIVNELGNDATEALLEPIQTTVTIALMHKSEKFKTTPNEIKEESENITATEKSPVHKETTMTRAMSASQIQRPNTPSEADFLSTGSVTVGGRSDKSITDLMQTEMITSPTALDSSNAFVKRSPKKLRRNRDIYTFNLYADTTPVRFLICNRKIRTFEEHLSILMKVIKLSRPFAQSNYSADVADERIEIVTATEENATIKEFMDLETSSESSKLTEEKKDTQLVISLFCQWTITRIALEIVANSLNYGSSKVIVDLEDILSTIDKREDYTKCTSKVGNLNVTYYEENSNNEWTSYEHLTIRLVGETQNLPFLNVIYTSVGLKQFFKRIGAKRKGDLSRNLAEIIITMQALEIIVNMEKIGKFVAAISGFFDRCHRSSIDDDNPRRSEEIKKNEVVNPKTASDLPMIHLDSKGFALYLPLENGRDCCSVAIFRIASVKITPNLQNPLQRKPLRPDVFSKAAQMGMLGTPGAVIEDRQYELTLRNISAATGSWSQIFTHMSEQRDNFFRTNPAVEWNNQNRKPNLQITDIFNNFSFIAIYAPSVVYLNVLICGQVVEFNCATDFVASFNMYQLNMMSCLIVHIQRILCFMQDTSKKRKRVSLSTKEKHCGNGRISLNKGNKCTSSMTTMLSGKSSSSALLCASAVSMTHLRDVRNSSTFSSIDEDTEHNIQTTDSGFQSCASQLTNTKTSKDMFGSISTISSTPAVQPRNVPQTISLVAGVFVIKFYDVKMRDNTDSDIYGNSCQVFRSPLFSFTLSQPSFMFTQNIYDCTMQISLYDFYIYLASANPSGPISHLIFNELVLDTRPGQANAAGITPPLLSIRHHCTKMQLRECDIDIAKPIALLLTEQKVNMLCQHILLIHATLLEDPCFEVRPKRNVSRGSKIKLMRQQCFEADRLHFNCRSFSIRFQNEDDDYNCKVVATDMKFNIKFLNRPEKATAKASIGAFYLLVDQQAIVHPINIRLSADFVIEPWHQLPLVTATIKANMIQLDVGINSVLHLQQAYKGYERLMENLQRQWKQFIRNRPFDKEESLQERNLEMLKCPPAAELSGSSSKCSLQREEFYQDDLRAGAFQFVKMYTDSFLPMPYQIQIIKKNFGIVCWRYPQPRKMSRIHVYPVPIHPIQIKCRMEYYSEAHETFLHFCDFYLSETISKQIELPEREICANIWRVVILQSLVSVNGDCFDDMIPEEDDAQKSIASIRIEDVLNSERSDPDLILDPKMLVGCMRIDTIFESSIVPKIQLLFQCNFVTIKMLNQPNQGAQLPSLLKKFNLVQTTQISQAFLIMNLRNLNVHTSIVSSDRYNIESGVTCSVKCLDYGFLNMLSVVEDTTVQSCIQVETEHTTNQRFIGFNLVLDRLRLNMGPSIVHTLLSSKLHWEEYMQSNGPQHAIVPKCIIVNRTYTYLTFGQSGTNERVQLKVRECCLYSFRSDFHNQELTFFITDAETEMTEVSQPVPISLKFNGEVLVQPVRVGKKCLFIKSRKLSPMQICVMIKGQIELVSMVPHDFYLDFRRESKVGPDKKSMEYLIEQRERACFYYSVQQRSTISMRLRFVNNLTTFKARSGDIPLDSKKNLPWLVKVPHPNGDFISFWVRVFREDIPELNSDNFKPQKILITIWPIFEICSMLPVPMRAEEKTNFQELEIPAMGKCEVLDAPVTHLTEHPIKFQFEHPISCQSQNEFLLTLKMFDWREFFWYDEQIRNVENVLSELGKPCSVKWPCNDEEELRVKRSIEEPRSPVIQYNCLPSRELSCTLRLEVSPYGYFINSTSMTIYLMNGVRKDNLMVHSNSIQMMFAVENFFTLEVSNATNFISSAPIYFEDTVNKAVSSSQYYVISEKTRADIVILRSDEVLKFVLSLKIEDNRKILTLRSKFVVTNFSNNRLCVLPFAMDHKESATRANVESLDSNSLKYETHIMKTRDDCVGISLDTFYDIFAQKAKRTIDTAFVCFACIKICTESDAPIPIPLSLPFTRRCFSAQNGCESIAFAVTLIEHDGIYYLNIFPDPAPALLINNQTDVNFLIAQTNASENSKVTNTTMEYIGRHFEWYQILKSYSNCYYTPPEMYSNFPDVDSAMCNLTLALYKENVTKKEIKWSKPIRTDKSWEKFLHIPNHGDVKVIICDKHRIIRISIFYILQQKEFSVKDLRSRLLTTQPSSIESDSDSVSSITTQQSSPAIEKLMQSHPTHHCRHFETIDTSYLRTQFQLRVYAKEIVLGLHTDNKERDCLKTEVLSTYVDDFMLVYDDASAIKVDGRTLKLVLSNLQIDNQLHSSGNFDFPVIICAQELYQRLSFLPQPHDLECVYKDLSSRAPMVLIALKFFDDEMSISDINCSFSPLRAYIEDAYLNELLDALVECTPSNCVYIPKTNVKRIELATGESLLPRDIAAQAICIAEPLQLRSFSIQPLNVLLSVHTSVRLYIALDHSPLSFSSYQRQQILTVPLRFGQSLGMHYLSGAIFGAGWVVGSLEILGSPSGLARSFTTGLRDFVAMPVQGLFRGPWGFIVGITQGSASLLRNVTAGTLNSVTKLAASVARNLDRLTLDREHIERTEALRRVRPNSLTEGFSQGLTGLGISILGAVGGIAHHTLEARSPVEVVAGVGKGLVGALTKPISGAAELLALAGQGVLQTVGFNALPQQRVMIVPVNPINEPSAYRIWKLLPSVLLTDQVLFYHEITLRVQQQMRIAYAFLTSTVFAILIAQWDKLEFAYAVNKVQITRDRDDKTLFYVHIAREDDTFDDSLSYTNERIMNFLRSSSSIRESRKISMFSLQELLHSVGNEDPANRAHRNLDWAFYINEHLGEHLMQYLKILRNEV